MAFLSTAWRLFSYLFLFVTFTTCNYVPDTSTFYLRHYFGKCLEYDASRKVFVFASICREKFRWSSGARFLHIATGKCVHVNSTSDGSFLGLSAECTSRGSLFQYDEANSIISHLLSGKCLHAESGSSSPPSSNPVIIKTGCSQNRNKFYFRRSVHYIIRQRSSGYCWVYDSVYNYVRLNRPLACERFTYENNYSLRHVNTGKCVMFEKTAPHYLRLSDDCNTGFRQISFFNLQVSPTNCIHPATGSPQPPANDALVSYPFCGDQPKLYFDFYDDRDTLKVKIRSESCDETGGVCSVAKGHIEINGFQYSLNVRGINVVLFDYRSGIFEHRSSYDVLGSSSPRSTLKALLDGLTPGKILFMAVKDAVYIDGPLAEALQKYGVSASFATTALPKSRCSMAAIAYTDDERKPWEESVTKPDCVGASVIEKTIYAFRDLHGKDDCSLEMGLQTVRVPNSAFSGSSVWGNDVYHMPYRARLHYHGPGWCSGYSTPITHYLQIDLGTVKDLTGIAIQSHGLDGGHHYITKFNLEYSTDNTNWAFYTGAGNSKVEFSGIRIKQTGETRLNWFQRIEVRSLRLHATARVTFAQTTCVRLELYGCTPLSPVFSERNKGSLRVLDAKENSFKVKHTLGYPSNAVFAISTSADDKTLGATIDQINFKKVDGKLRFQNGTIASDLDTSKLIPNADSGIPSTATVEFNALGDSYYIFSIESLFQVIDAKQGNGNITVVLSFQTKEQLCIIAQPTLLIRKETDRGIIEFNVTDINRRPFHNGESIQLNISYAHWLVEPDGSHSNAYDIETFIYYDTSFVDFQSMQNVERDQFSLAPTSNATQQGLIRLHTDALWLPSNQVVSLNFKAKIPAAVMKGENCEGAFLIEVKYMNNLAFLNGKANYSIENTIRYRCKVHEWKDISLSPIRLSVPQLSMLHDDKNAAFYFCLRPRRYTTRNGPFCYWQKNDSVAWHGINGIAAIVGIDVTSKTLYGIDRAGVAYMRVSYPFKGAFQIEDAEWTGKGDEAEIRKSLKVEDIKTLPRTPTEGTIISASGDELWAATRSSIRKKVNSIWLQTVRID